MPRFTGKQYPGALKDLREQRKLEAQQRSVAHQLRSGALAAREAGHIVKTTGWAQVNDHAHDPRILGDVTRLLNAIFGSPLDREVQP